MNARLFIASILFAGSIGYAAAEPKYVVSANTVDSAVVFRTLSDARDALDLIQAGSALAAAPLVLCLVPNGTPVKLYPGRGDKTFARALVLDGESAGCRGYILRSHTAMTRQ